jgi:phage replication O-like protein O
VLQDVQTVEPREPNGELIMQTDQQEVNKAGAGENVLPFPAGGKRVKAGTEDGYTKLANELLEAVCGLAISSRKIRVFMAIIRKTYGFNKKIDRIASSQIAKLVGCSADNVRHDIIALKALNLIAQDGEKIGPNPVISDWKEAKNEPKKRVKIDAPCVNPDAPKATQNDHQSALSLTQGCVNPDTESALDLTHTKEKRNYSKDIGAIQESLPLPDEQPKPKTQAKPSRKKPGKPIDPNFQITEELRDWAITKQIPVDLSLETERFVNHWQSKGEIRADWAASWRNWMLNAKKYAAERGQPMGTQPERRKLAEFKPVEAPKGARPTQQQRQALRAAMGINNHE